MLEAARLGQRIAAFPNAPAVLGQGVVVTVVVTLARALDDYKPKRGRWGTLYIRQTDNTFALLDRGDRVTVAHVDTDTVRAALALAASKWQTLELTGDIQFQREAVRQAVRMGLGERLAGLPTELEALRRDESARLAAERAKQPMAERTPAAGAPTRAGQSASPLPPMAPTPASRRRSRPN